LGDEKPSPNRLFLIKKKKKKKKKKEEEEEEQARFNQKELAWGQEIVPCISPLVAAAWL
jgi:hypothetical protein